MKRSWFSIALIVLVCAALITGCAPQAPVATPAPAPAATPAAEAPSAPTEAPKAEAPQTEANIVKGAEIKPPPGKQILNVPADVVAQQQFKIATIGMNTNPFDLKVYEGIKFAGDVLKDRNVKCDFVSIKEHNITEYEATIRSLMAAGYNAITCNGFGSQLEPLIAEGREQGIPFFIFNNPTSDTSQEMSFWGQSGFDGGKKLGEMALELCGGKGEYAIITGNFNLSGHEDRRKGFRSVMDANSDMKLVLETENKDLYEKAYEITTNLITSNPNLKVLYVTAGGPFGAAKAIEDAGKTGQIIMVCHDWMDETIPYVRSGTISGCLDQDPFTQGYAPIIDAYNYLVAGKEPKKLNMIEGQIATPQNVAELIPQ